MAANRVVFKNSYNKKVSRNFYKYYMLRNSFFMYFISLMGLMCLFMLATGMITAEDGSFQYVLMTSIAMIGILFVPGYTFINIRTAANKDYLRRKDMVEIYEISKEKIQRSVVGGTKKVVLNWVNISKVIEVDEAYYFFTTADEAFTIPKEGLIEGTIENLRHIITIYMKKDKKGKVPFKIKDKVYLKAKKELKKQQKSEKRKK